MMHHATETEWQTIARVQKEMLANIEQQLWETSPLRVETHELTDQRTLRVSYDLSLAQLHLERNQRDMLDHIMKRCADQLGERVAQLIDDRVFDALITGAIKDAVRDEVKKAVAARVEDFIQEIL